MSSTVGAKVAVAERPDLLTLTADGGFNFRSNCPVCAGGWILEGKSLGREDLPKPVNEVKQVVTCSDCGLNGLIRVDLLVITTDKRRKP